MPIVMNILNIKHIERLEDWKIGYFSPQGLAFLPSERQKRIDRAPHRQAGKSSFFAILLTLAVVLAASCAKPGTLTGGPKDEKPPVILGTEPQNGSTQFSAKEFVINFDEYVTVRDAENNILVSPPMKHKPEYSTRGKGIVVRLRDTLRENTTYLFQFKEGIADFNEGNILNSFEYVFSTGSSIDSMTLRGTVQDAFSGKPHEEPVSVLAFAEEQIADSIGDSVVAKVQPMYMTRCDKEGHFALNHLRQGRYLILALEDANKDLHFDAGEPVGFLDTLILATHMPGPPDTVHRDTAALDSAALDSLRIADSIALAKADSITASIPQIRINLSLLKKEAQRVLKSEMPRQGFCEISLALPLSDSSQLVSLDGNPIYVKYEPHRDTLHVWSANPTADSLVLLLTDTNLHDTLSLRYRAKTKMKTPSTSKESSLRCLSGSSHPYFDTLWIASTKPINNSDTITDSIVSIFCLSDSTTALYPLKWKNDILPQGSSQAMILFDGKQGEKYKISIPQDQFKDIYGAGNDSLVTSVSYTQAEQYGNIILTITRPDSLADSIPIFIELTDASDKVIRQHKLIADEKVTFSHLKGDKYNLRAFIDYDGDGIWSPGDYYAHRQPEPIFRFEKTLELRENWDMEEKWPIPLAN